MANNTQIIALPVEPYLAQYIAGKTKLPICINDDESITVKLPITKHSLFGEIIYEKLEPATSHKLPVSNLYITIPGQINCHKKTKADSRTTRLTISPKNITVIRKFFRELLEAELVAMIEGASFVYEEIKGVKKGIFNKAIHQFMKKYGMEGNQTTFGTLQKIAQRNKKRSNTAKILTF
ncbi:hypothetical protein EZY14_002775 [Kordia sp. TARA_039_SRF]|nr:hypothetical protein EZY14_002775 [Kordia sp. TARA_039_SRF]